MKHLSETELALLAGGDLDGFQRFRAALHIRRCPNCRQALLAFESTRVSLQRQGGEMPAGFDWPRLSLEMTANIKLGVVAGRIAASSNAVRDRLSWRAAAVLAGSAAVLAVAWWLNVPKIHPPESRTARIVLQATPDALRLENRGSALMLLHTRGQGGTVTTVSAPGSLKASFVDGETGQITINKVYAE